MASPSVSVGEASALGSSFRENVTDITNQVWQARQRFGKRGNAVVTAEKHKARREVVEKVAAILVALSWSRALATLGYDWWVHLFIASAVYFAFWAIIWYSAIMFNQIVFEQGVLFAAELTAFLWRDTTREIFGELVPAVAVAQSEADGADDELKEETGHVASARDTTRRLFRVVGRSARVVAQAVTQEPERGDGQGVDVGLGFKYVAFGAVLLLIGMLWFGVARRMREHAEAPEEVVEAISDIDIDLWGLTVGWTLQAAVGAFLFGVTWMEVVDEKLDPDLAWYGVAFLVPVLGGLVLAALRWAGAPEESARFLITLQTTGFLTGYLLDVFISRAFLPTMPVQVWQSVTTGSIVYPLVSTFVGAGIIARKRGAVIEGRTEVTAKHKVSVLAFQMFIALSWEGLFERFFESFDGETGILALAQAISFTVNWVVICVVTAKIGKSENDEASASSAPSGDIAVSGGVVVDPLL